MVARVALHNIRQDRDEPIRTFGARLAGQAGVCKFTIKCPSDTCGCEVNYTEAIVRDTLIRGVADPDIQLDLLSHKKQDMSLEDMLQFVEAKEAKEAGKRLASRLLDTHTTDATSDMVNTTSSSYQRNKRLSVKVDQKGLCTYCGKAGHGERSLARFRKTDCPAYGHKCQLCSKDHHFESVCRSKDRPLKRRPKPSSENCEGAVFDTLCMMTSSLRGKANKSISIDHHLSDNMSKTWMKRSSQPQPFVSLTIRASHRDYRALGFTLGTPSKSVNQPAMADTGCQSCLAGIIVLYRLGLTPSDLIPVTMRMHAAENKDMNILGATMLHITAKNANGRIFETRQMVYITDCSEKFFFSRGASVDLCDAVLRNETGSPDSSPTNLYLPTPPETTASTTPSTIPCNRRKQGKIAEVSIGLLQIQHVQYMRPPAPSPHGGSPRWS